MSLSPHVICSQRVVLRLGGAANAASLHRVEHALLAPALLEAITTALDEALDATGLPPDTWLTLDRLILDLGNLSSDDLAARLLELLPQHLSQALAQALPARRDAQADGNGGNGTSLSSQLNDPNKISAVGVESSPAAAAAAWLYFLQHGILPAHWPSLPRFADWKKILSPTFSAPPAMFVAELRSILTAETGRLRLVRQFSATVVADVVAILAPTATRYRNQLGQALIALRRAAASPNSLGLTAYLSSEAVELAVVARAVRVDANALAWAALLAALQAATPFLPIDKEQQTPAAKPLSLQQLVGGALDASPATKVGVLLDPMSSIPDHLVLNTSSDLALQPTGTASPEGDAVPASGTTGSSPGDVALASNDIALASGTTAAARGDVVSAFDSATAAPGKSRPDPEKAIVQADASLRSFASRASLPSPSTAFAAFQPPNGEYVNNAGVVLLHPFLGPAFEACGWLADEQFISPEAQRQAVLFVHFLATGHRQAPEYELRLPQLLCGVPLNAPPPARRLRLKRAAQAEGLELLRAALAHWGALRDTTPGGLRTAFLQREGKLETLTADGLPVLSVAQQPQDVLLSKLPYGWGVGLVQLPWLSRPMHVNWA